MVSTPKEKSSRFLILVASLGYFVDIYDLLIFSIVREPSLKAIGVADNEIVGVSSMIINWQMIGLLLGGILWGIMGDKRGRLSVLFGSILLYSVTNFINGFVQTVDQYALLRFITGIGLAGELGAGITLVSEMMPKNKRGIMTSFIAGVGVFGAVLAYFIFKFTGDWRLCYKIGGVLGLGLLLLRVSVAESIMYKRAAGEQVQKGNIFQLFVRRALLKKYMLAILVGIPSWFIVGILITLSNRFAVELFGSTTLVAGACVMYGYIGNAFGDITVGIISQYYESRKKALYFMYACCILTIALSNMVRGSLPLMNLLFNNYFIKTLHWSMVKSGVITASIVVFIALIALAFTEETFHKDLDYIEE